MSHVEEAAFTLARGADLGSRRSCPRFRSWHGVTLV